jgi:CubicO group peptidase (beta-lactamase class C family)
MMANLIAPSKDGLMVGFPPPPDKRVTASNSHRPEHLGWRVQNSGRLYPSARISRGEGAIVPLPVGAALDVEALAVEDGQGAVLPMPEVWRRTGVDATLVLHRGKIVHESYLGDMRPTRIHAMFSATKSIVGLLVECLIREGRIDEGQCAAAYLPELQASPVGSATVRQLLDMRANFKFSEKPKVPDQIQADYIMGVGFIPRPAGYSGPDGAYELLIRAQAMEGHGGAFRYDNGSTDALGWILRRATGLSLDELISDRIWSRLGAEHDASMMIDAAGVEWAAAGMGACLRDFGRLGEMLRGDGHFNGQQILPSALFADIRQGGDRQAFAASGNAMVGGSYRSHFWFCHDRHHSFCCRGQYGQRLWIAPSAETVIAQFAVDPTLDAQEPLRLRGYQAIADALRLRGAA